MLRWGALLLDERRQAGRRGFEAWILTSRWLRIWMESESSYWLLGSEDNGSGNGCPSGGECEWCCDGCPAGTKNLRCRKRQPGGLRGGHPPAH
ncbi:hypothetical protein TNCV_5135211 [Trichonephila clavipes]|nr:hypothetical protein TNCV_5135211 [Trichonephila clavipes]